MSKVGPRGERIRRFIIEHVQQHPRGLSAVIAEKFGITRQSVSKHLRRLVDEKILVQKGNTRRREYHLQPLKEWKRTFPLTSELEEGVIWRQHISPLLVRVPDNALAIWQYGFTEMLNNAIDHSGGSTVNIMAKRTAAYAEIVLHDNGVGIFKKIQTALGLLDERHAVLELAKGKFTTDPARHTGEGIFFTSRMFDEFGILSGTTFFSHNSDAPEDWILEGKNSSARTVVWMVLNNHTSRTAKQVFDKFSTGDQYGFTNTVVPVRLAQYGDDLLVSRSQARRVLVRVDRFKAVIFDFNEVKEIGQAFADEIFRVFSKEHPDIKISAIKANSAVKRMITRAESV